jgi:hypothetical protein
MCGSIPTSIRSDGQRPRQCLQSFLPRGNRVRSHAPHRALFGRAHNLQALACVYNEEGNSMAKSKAPMQLDYRTFDDKELTQGAPDGACRRPRRQRNVRDVRSGQRLGARRRRRDCRVQDRSRPKAGGASPQIRGPDGCAPGEVPGRKPVERLRPGPTACRHPVSGTVSLPSSGCFSPFPHGTGSAYDRDPLRARPRQAN